MTSTLNDVKRIFIDNIESVHKVLNLDDFIQSLCLKALEKADRGLKKFNITNPQFGVANEIKVISDIRSHKSLQLNYEVMYNQCVVLLVSHFTSAVEDIFEVGFTNRFKDEDIREIGKEDIKLTLGELHEFGSNICERIGEIVITKKEISFQDMQSITRNFNYFLGFEPGKDANVNNIILSQACRHCIVHSGGVLNDKGAKQIASANPRAVKKELKKGDKIQFQQNEIEIIARSMLHYVDGLVNALTREIA